MTQLSEKDIRGTPYYYSEAIDSQLSEMDEKVAELRRSGRLSPAVLKGLSKFFRVKNIYNSNAIEGNQLDYNETRLVVEQGLTISGKSLQDTLEAKNLSDALDLFESLSTKDAGPILEADIRNLHCAVLKGVNDQEAGKYRDVPVAITGSAHKPPGPESVAPEMEQLVSWMKTLDDSLNPVIVASAIHTWFVSIHPFVDGNGRVARLLLNLFLMRHGYPIAVISIEDRKRYYEALGESDAGGDLTSLINLVAESTEDSLDEYLRAASEQRETQDWAQSLVFELNKTEVTRAKNVYAVWFSAMDLMKSHFRQVVDLLNEMAASTGGVQFKFREYGALEFEKFQILQNHQSAKKTWFFGVEVRVGGKSVRFLFYFGFANDLLWPKLGRQAVTVRLAYSVGQSKYENLDQTQVGHFPELCEIGYAPKQEKFVERLKNGTVQTGRIEDIARSFFSQIKSI